MRALRVYNAANHLDPYIRCGLHHGCTHQPWFVLDADDADQLRNAHHDVAAGTFACMLHRPRPCRHCGSLIPWHDGSLCDRCDRYADEDGG